MCVYAVRAQPNQETSVLTESWDVQHVGDAPVADIHLQEVFVSTLFNDLLQRFGHFSRRRRTADLIRPFEKPFLESERIKSMFPRL